MVYTETREWRVVDVKSHNAQKTLPSGVRAKLWRWVPAMESERPPKTNTLTTTSPLGQHFCLGFVLQNSTFTTLTIARRINKLLVSNDNTRFNSVPGHHVFRPPF